jgi:hypothetical protein
LAAIWGAYYAYTKLNNVTVSSVQLDSAVDSAANNYAVPAITPGTKDIELQRELNQ